MHIQKVPRALLQVRILLFIKLFTRERSRKHKFSTAASVVVTDIRKKLLLKILVVIRKQGEMDNTFEGILLDFFSLLSTTKMSSASKGKSTINYFSSE